MIRAEAKIKRGMAQIEESVTRYLHPLESADRREASKARELETTRLKEKIAKLGQEMRRLEALDERRRSAPDLSKSPSNGRLRRSRG